MADEIVLETVPLTGSPWPTIDPFLFCVHHDDAYPEGNGRFGPDASLEGREMGADFAGVDGGPGAPRQRHRLQHDLVGHRLLPFTRCVT